MPKPPITAFPLRKQTDSIISLSVPSFNCSLLSSCTNCSNPIGLKLRNSTVSLSNENFSKNVTSWNCHPDWTHPESTGTTRPNDRSPGSNWTQSIRVSLEKSSPSAWIWTPTVAGILCQSEREIFLSTLERVSFFFLMYLCVKSGSEWPRCNRCYKVLAQRIENFVVVVYLLICPVKLSDQQRQKSQDLGFVLIQLPGWP